MGAPEGGSTSPRGNGMIHRVSEQPVRTADLLVRDAELVATVDERRREIPGGWVAVTDGVVSAVGGPGDPAPEAARVLDAAGCLVTPGLVNSHHHLYQNLTRAFAPALTGGLFDWLETLYPLWARLDEEAAYVSAYVGLTELALGGATTSADHLYVHPRGRRRPDHGRDPCRRRSSGCGSTRPGARCPCRSRTEGCRRTPSCRPTTRSSPTPSGWCSSTTTRPRHSMLRVALAPCSPFSVSAGLMRATAELAEELDVRLHTHLCETEDENDFCLQTLGMRPVDYFDEVGWGSSRSWIAHGVWPDADEVRRLGAWGTGVAHCPSSNMILGSGLAPVAELRAAGAPVGLGCDGSASADSASLWLEARTAMLQGKLRHGAAAMSARDALEVATRGGAGCLGRTGEIGELSVGACGDLVVWPLTGAAYAGALSDPIEGWLRCGPGAARHTVVAGRPVVLDGVPVHPGLPDALARHRVAAERMQAPLV